MSKKSKQSRLSSFFSASDKCAANKKQKRDDKINHLLNTDTNDATLAEYLSSKLNGAVTYITNDRASWIIHVPQWMPSVTAPSRSDIAIDTTHTNSNSSISMNANTNANKNKNTFEVEWSLHPTERKKVKIFDRLLNEKRWSTAWGKSIGYSGLVNEARDMKESRTVMILMEKINALMKDSLLGLNNKPKLNSSYEPEQQTVEQLGVGVGVGVGQEMYNACLQNWYEPEDTMGLHADDEHYLRPDLPIFSLSQGGSRRFLLRSKCKTNSNSIKEKIELWLDDGDLLVMGGTTQLTHKHEVPKHRVKDPMTSRRINWTVRAVKEEH